MPITRRSLPALCFFAALVVQAAAETHTVTLKECGDLKEQGDMNGCFYRYWKQADADLNASYNALVKRLPDATARSRLRDAQRAWLTYRDKNCAFLSWATEGGSVQPTVTSACMADMTRERIKELETQLNCQEGDLTCAAQRPKH